MLTHHDDLELAAGDEWAIAGLLLDEEGNALDLTAGVQLGWTMRGPDGKTIPGLIDGGATLEPSEPTTSGEIVIVLPGSLTKTFPPGRYTDAVRSWVGGVPALMWVGQILVACDPFASELP